MRRIISILAVVAFALGCAKYRAQSIPRLYAETCPHAEVKEGVAVAIKVFSEEDCKRYFDSNLIDEGYQPIQFTIQNDAEAPYLVTKHAISLPCASSEEVAQKAHRSTVARATTYGILGVFIWPFIIPAIVDGVGSSKANTQMDIDFAAKELRELVVVPTSSVNSVIFVPTSEMRSALKITLLNSQTKEALVFEFTEIGRGA